MTIQHVDTIGGPKASFNISGIDVDALTYKETIRNIRMAAEIQKPAYVCILNVHVMVTATRNDGYRRIINQSLYTLPDGMPIVWFARNLLNCSDIHRITGPSLMIKCFEELADLNHFFLGSTEQTLRRMVTLCHRKHPNLNIVGTFSPPFKPFTKPEIVKMAEMLNAASADIVWVGLGAPKQEIWMNETMRLLSRGVLVGVGAAFDYYCGNIKRPPKWLRRSGLEWICRLIQEPTRLWKRYLVTNSLFGILILKSVLACKRNSIT